MKLGEYKKIMFKNKDVLKKNSTTLEMFDCEVTFWWE